uniref:SFRICE_038376 n=1 Tax=Spodoptera frugiperda TaxID=7108 RepID=A0A2H1WV46_SPOFR
MVRADGSPDDGASFKSKYVRRGLEENIVKNTNTGAKRLVTAIFRHKDKMSLQARLCSTSHKITSNPHTVRRPALCREHDKKPGSRVSAVVRRRLALSLPALDYIAKSNFVVLLSLSQEIH